MIVPGSKHVNLHVNNVNTNALAHDAPVVKQEHTVLQDIYIYSRDYNTRAVDVGSSTQSLRQFTSITCISASLRTGSC
jgi:hypothetical protein